MKNEKASSSGIYKTRYITILVIYVFIWKGKITNKFHVNNSS